MTEHTAPTMFVSSSAWLLGHRLRTYCPKMSTTSALRNKWAPVSTAPARAHVRMSASPATAPNANKPSAHSANDSESSASSDTTMRANFIKTMIENDLKSGKHTSVITRFPPEPNGYLHLGHAKSILLNFGIARLFNGKTNLRFDDTNPVKEDEEYVNAIERDVHWLVGKDPLTGEYKDPWNAIFFASDYFDDMYKYAEELITKGLAYVCELTPDQLSEYRGNLTTPGKDSPYRNRTVEENLNLFRDMRDGKIEDGKMVLRAKIDMQSSNINMRDPTLYRVRKVPHHRTGDTWCIYPMYDFAHCLSDAAEGITHSLCTLEFEGHRPLYDWFLDNVSVKCHPQQIEFSRLNIQYTVLSKRKLITLVEKKVVDGWDDPRMPTICGMRRRGYTPEALALFADRIGISKADSNIDMSVLEDCVRADLEDRAPRAFAVLDPIKLTITNWPKDKKEVFEAPVHPKYPERGSRKVTFSGSVYIDSSDFMENPPSKFFRLGPDRMVRLKFAYVVQCHKVIKNASGKVVELECTYIPETRAGNTPEGMKKVKGIIQWVSCDDAMPITVRTYDRLFSVPWPGKDQPDGDFLKDINRNSLQVVSGYVEPSMATCCTDLPFQFERIGYYYKDEILSKDSEQWVFNRVCTLRDTWAKEASVSS